MVTQIAASIDTESAIVMEAIAMAVGSAVHTMSAGRDMRIVLVGTATVEAVVHISMTGGVRGRNAILKALRRMNGMNRIFDSDLQIRKREEKGKEAKCSEN